MNEANNNIRSLGVARRSVWYILRFMLVVTVVVFLSYVALVEAMYIMNINILVTEGMEYRTDCILGGKTELDLQEYFDTELIERDTAIRDDKYSAFHIDSYDHRFNIEKIKVYPWSKEAKVRVIERVINIQATPIADITNPVIPKWDDARMDITLEKKDGRWFITDIEIVERDPEGSPGATPDYSKLTTDVPHY